MASKAICALLLLVVIIDVASPTKGVERNCRTFKEQGLAELLQALARDDAETRATAALRLGTLRVEVAKVLPALLTALTDRDPLVRQAAAISIGEMGAKAKSAVPRLGDTLRDPADFVAYSAARALMYIGPAAIPQLVKSLQDDDSHVRALASDALSKMADGDIGLAVWVAVVDILKKGKKEVRKDAAEVLSNQALLVRNRGQDTGVFLRVAGGPLGSALRDKEAIVRIAAANALWTITGKPDEVISVLVKATEEKDEEVRKAAVEAIMRIGPDAKQAVPTLVHMLKDRNWALRMASAAALGRIGPAATEAIPLLLDTLHDKQAYVRAEAARALGEIGTDAKMAGGPLTELLKDPHPTVRWEAARALGKLGVGTRKADPRRKK